MSTTNVHCYPLVSGIRSTPEFARKKLADFAVNVGLKCEHGCTYCSSGASLRCHDAFRELGENPYESGYAIVDPDMPEKVAIDAKRKRKRGMVQLCTTVDAWCPSAQQYALGRRCLEALLSEPRWTVRILTKNAAVVEDFDLIEQHRDRVLVGISLTSTVAKEDMIATIEPNASPISDRMAALEKAHSMGLRTFGMLCPILPGIADHPTEIDQLVSFVKGCGAEEVFAEAVNPRGPGLVNTEEALVADGFNADPIARIRQRTEHSRYVADLAGNVQSVMRSHGMIDKLRFLLYESGIAEQDSERIQRDDEGVIWL